MVSARSEEAAAGRPHAHLSQTRDTRPLASDRVSMRVARQRFSPPSGFSALHSSRSRSPPVQIGATQPGVAQTPSFRAPSGSAARSQSSYGRLPHSSSSAARDSSGAVGVSHVSTGGERGSRLPDPPSARSRTSLRRADMRTSSSALWPWRWQFCASSSHAAGPGRAPPSPGRRKAPICRAFSHGGIVLSPVDQRGIRVRWDEALNHLFRGDPPT